LRRKLQPRGRQIGRVLRDARVEAGASQESTANWAKVGKNTVAWQEHGNVSQVVNFVKILASLGYRVVVESEAESDGKAS
jgi:DNA-binding XRE family transcriptional regulator